jgi:predicted anti-sigma-YlaC factor YlaD
MTTCPTEIILQAFLDGELTVAELQAIASHLDSCASCRQTVTRMRQIHTLLAAVGPHEPPSDLPEQIEAAVRTHGEGLPCSHAREMVLIALDDQLSEMEHNALDSHLSECADCRFYDESMTEVVSGLRQVATVKTPRSLRRRIEVAVAQAAGASAPRLHRNLTIDWRQSLAAMAGLAAAAAILVAVVMQPLGAPPASREMALPSSQTIAAAETAPSAMIGKAPESAIAPVPNRPAVPPDPALAATTHHLLPPSARQSNPAKDHTSRRSKPLHRPPAATPAKSFRVASAASTRDVRGPSDAAHTIATSSSTPAPADVQTSVRAGLMTVTPLIEAKPVDVARLGERSVPPTTRVGTIQTDPYSDREAPTSPTEFAMAPESRRLPRPAIDGSTPAKASPPIPVTLRSAADTAVEAPPTRLASASSSWLPVHEPTRSVYSAPPAASSRLATASERISRELGDLKQAPASPAIVVIK